MKRQFLAAMVVQVVVTGAAWGQSSSLYVQPATRQPDAATYDRPYARPQSQLAPALAQRSFTSVRPAEPRQFAVHDLVTIVVRELSQADSSASLETEKDAQFDGAVNAFPDMQLSQLLDFQLAGSRLANPPKLDVELGNQWEGEGTYERKDSVSDRVTARVIDVKPNGLLVLEARKSIRNDREGLQIVLTGTCRAEDVSIDNTVLSTQLYNLHLDRQHEGELRKSTKKGLITKVLEGLFSF